MTHSAEKSPDSKLRTLALILLPIFGIVLVGAVIYSTKTKDKAAVTVVYSAEEATDINTGDIIDATARGAVIEAKLGYRYKVFVNDESDDRSSGIAKLGGLVTFIPGARRGQTAIIDVTRVRERVADAVLVQVLSQVDLPPKAPRGPYSPPAGDSTAHIITGAEMDVIISEASTKNPETEGVARVSGLVIFVNGVPTIGERVNVRITDRRERLAFAEPTGQPAGTDPLPASSAPRRQSFTPASGDPVVVGAEMDVIISEASSKNPDTEGVARINGLVVFVDGATTIGERVNIRITGRRDRMAFAETTGKPAGEAELASGSSTRKPRHSFTPSPGDSAAHVIEGAEMDVIISEKSSKNPDTEGVTRINGLVVFVDGATEMGKRVNVRITGRGERMAWAELTGKPTGTSALPKSTARRNASRAPRKSFVPKAGDANAHIVPGVILATTILEPSTKNPDTEGVAKVNGMVIFVKGATTPGQTVNVRITDRRERVAMGEVTLDAPTAAEEASPEPTVSPAP